jgi:hypothetical protein
MRILGENAYAGFQHDWKFPKMNAGKGCMHGVYVVEIFARSNDIVYAHINCHCGGVCKISNARLLREHDLSCAVIFVNLWAMHAEIFKRYLYGERMLFRHAVVILVGRNADWIEHFNCGGNELANELVVRLQLVSYKLFQMLTCSKCLPWKYPEMISQGVSIYLSL